MLHEVVWQHMQGLVGSLITTLLQIYQGIFRWKTTEMKWDKIWQNYGYEFGVSFLAYPMERRRCRRLRLWSFDYCHEAVSVHMSEDIRRSPLNAPGEQRGWLRSKGAPIVTRLASGP